MDHETIARLSTEEIMDQATESARRMAEAAGHTALLLGELDRREGWRDDGATSLEAWVTARLGVSAASARALSHVAGRLFDLPHLAAGLSTGEISFDKVRAVVDQASPESDRALAERAREHSVVELTQLGRAEKAQAETVRAEKYERRSLRFNDTFRTMTAQLPPECYAEVRACLESAARDVPSDGDTPWDQRLCDALLGLLWSRTGVGVNSAFTVVAHVALETIMDETNEIAGELERDGWISAETVRRIACDATVIVAADDDAGHTMYEGRAQRFPTASQRRELMRRDRHCRFPGCTNVIFVNPHHIRWWRAHGGTTDLPNLILLCEHHHHLVHTKGWTVSGDANLEVTFAGPTGRVMTSRPSPLWGTATRV